MIRGMMFSGQEFRLNITASVASPNLPALASAAGWNNTSRLLVNITAPYVNTLNLLAGWSFPGGLEIVIAAGSLIGSFAVGATGQTAFTANTLVSVRNNGTIAGCGGAGGNGAIAYVEYGSFNPRTWAYGGAGGRGQGFADATSISPVAAASGVGGYTEYFSGEVLPEHTRPWATSGGGGNGGTWGSYGGYGGASSVGGTYSDSYSLGLGDAASPPGKAVVGNANITWLATGTRLGAIT